LKEIRQKRKWWKLSSPKLVQFWYSLSSNQSFCFGENFPNFDLKNNNYNLYKGFPIKKMAQICQILKKKVSKSPDERNMRVKPHSMAIGGKSTKQDHALDSTLY
jgi:hypothetical protein